MNKTPRLRAYLAFFAASIAVAAVTALPSRSQIYPMNQTSGAEVAVSSEVHQHIHSIALRTQDINQLISLLNNDNDFVSFESSTGFDNGFPSGVIHTHRVDLRRRDLIQLVNTGELTVQSSITLDHSHLFKFVRRDRCPAIATPVPSISPSPSPSPSVSPSVSPIPTPSGSPSGFPPSGGPSGGPSGTP